MTLVFNRLVREIELPAVDGTKVALQDLYNESQIYLALSENMDLETFIEGSGKQSLGGVSQVGMTIQLTKTWLLGFEARSGPAVIACLVNGGNLTALHTDTGSATSTGTTTLIDSAGAFARQGFQTGDTIRNITDGSSATILTVDSETQLTHTTLTGGSGNDWDIADVWEIDSTHPFFPTDFVHIAFAQDVAPLAIDTSQLIPDECHLVAAYSEGSTEVRIGAWLERIGQVAVAATSCTITWYNPDGTQLFQATDNAPDAQGQFRITQSQVLAVDSEYYAIVSITDSSGTVTTRRGLPTSQ